MAWVGAITNAGAALLNQWIQGTQLTVSQAKSGSGTVAVQALVNQTNLVSVKQTMSIIKGLQTEDSRKIKLQITAPQTSYTLNQIGIWATLNDESVLLAIYQNSEGILIPSVSEQPDFSYTFYAILSISTEGDFELTIDTQALVSESTMEEYVLSEIELLNIGDSDIGDIGDGTVKGAIINLDERVSDTKDSIITGVSSDVADGQADSWTSVSPLTSGETHSSIFSKISQMFKNTRYIFKMLGTTDISRIGNGTITGGLAEYYERVAHAHNTHPRYKDITAYYNDGTLWNRISGTGYPTPYWDIFAGDYIKMSRPISAYERTGQYQHTGSQYVTVASCGGLWGVGDSNPITYPHLVMVPGQGEGGTQHFGRSRMNNSNTTVGGYKGSEMHTTTIGAVTSSGSTGAQATINQQLYAEFGAHLKTVRALLSNSINATGYNRLGTNSGCSNNWGWISVQAVLMSEVELYGSEVWSSSGYDTGEAKNQFALFRMSTQALNNRSAWFWLRGVVSASYFCHSNRDGRADYDSASDATDCVRPRFVIA